MGVAQGPLNRRISFIDLIPQLAKELTTHGYPPDYDCLDAVLRWDAKALGTAARRQLMTHESTRLFERRYKILPEPDRVRYGDVIVVCHSDRTIVHWARYINPGVVWHKASRFPVDPVTFERSENLLKFYQGAFPRDDWHLDYYTARA